MRSFLSYSQLNRTSMDEEGGGVAVIFRLRRVECLT